MLKFVGLVVDIVEEAEKQMQAGVSGRRCGFINKAPQLINEAQYAKNSLAHYTKLIKSDHSPNSKFLSSHPREPQKG